MIPDENTVKLFALHRAFLYEPGTLRRLIADFGNEQLIFDQKDRFDNDPELGRTFRNIDLDKEADTLGRILDSGIQVITYRDTCFPLKEDHQSNIPVMLFLRSATPASDLFGNTDKYVAVTGTRDPSLYGLQATKVIIREDLDRESTVVSGLSVGIERQAHLSALEYGLKTIAVLPYGIDSVYPYCSRALADRIATTPGCAIISLFPPGIAPTPANFLLKNSIIAALGKTTIITSCRVKGSGITVARISASLGNSVLAVPGQINDRRSEGCNMLIDQKTAKIYTRNH